MITLITLWLGQGDHGLLDRRRQWAEEFRSSINSFVYRKGNGEEPQSWPLIRQVSKRDS